MSTIPSVYLVQPFQDSCINILTLTDMDHEDDHFFKEIEGLSNLLSPPEDHSANYYNEYCRLYLANFVLTSQMKELIKDKQDLELRLFRLEDKHDDFEYSETQDRNKRHRRTANEINRYHKCSVITCQKSYGSEGSLNQHIKLKHPELVVKEQEDSAQESKNQKENISDNQEIKRRK